MTHPDRGYGGGPDRDVTINVQIPNGKHKANDKKKLSCHS